MLSSLKNLSGTLLAIAQTRLSLLGNELQAQKILLVQLAGLFLVVLFCTGLAVLSGIGLVVSVWWEQRVLVLAVLAAVFMAVAVGCYLRLKKLLNPAEEIFGASLAALQDDLAALRAAAPTNQTSSGQDQRSRGGE